MTIKTSLWSIIKRQLRSSITGILCLIIVAASLLYYCSYYNKAPYLAKDEGLLACGAVRVLRGELPYIRQPGVPLILAAWFSLTETTFASQRLLCVYIFVVSNVLLFWVGSRVLPILPALIPVGIHLIIPGPWDKCWFAFTSLIGISLIFLYLRHPNHWWAFIAASGCSLLFVWMRVDIGGYLMATMVVAVIVRRYEPRNTSSMTQNVFYTLRHKDFLWVIFGFVTGWATITLYYILIGKSPFDFIKFTLMIIGNVVAASRACKLWTTPNMFRAVWILLVPITTLIAYSYRRNRLRFSYIVICLTMTVFCSIHDIGWSIYYRLPEDGFLMYILLLLAGTELCRFLWLQSYEKPLRMKIICIRNIFVCSILLIGGVFYYIHYSMYKCTWDSNSYNGYSRGSPSTSSFERVKLPRAGNFMLSKTNCRRIEDCVQAIDAIASKDGFVMYGCNTMLSFFSGHPTPSFEDVLWLSFEREYFMNDLLKRMEETPPKAIVLSRVDFHFGKYYGGKCITQLFEYIAARFDYYGNYDGCALTVKYYIFVKTKHPDTISTRRYLDELLRKYTSPH